MRAMRLAGRYRRLSLTAEATPTGKVPDIAAVGPDVATGARGDRALRRPPVE